MRHQAGVWCVSLCVISLTAWLASCSKPSTVPVAEQSTTPPSAAAPSAAAVAAAPAAVPAAGPIAAASTPIASAQNSVNPSLRADLLEVKRVSGGALLIQWRLVDTDGVQQNNSLVANAGPKPIDYGVGSLDNWAWADLYYTDPAENKKYGFLTDTDGARLLDVFIGTMNAGDQRQNWAKFPAPPATSTKVTVYIPRFPPFEDVPIS